MAVGISEKPHLIDFAGNLLYYKLRGTPIEVSGRKAVTKWKINTLPQLNYSFVISYAEKQFAFTVKTTTLARNLSDSIGNYTNPAELKAELVLKIAENYELGKDFKITISDALEITFTSLYYGGENVSLSSSDPLASFTRTTITTGIERKLKSGYKIYACIDIIRNSGSTVQQLRTPPILLSLDNSNKATLPLSLLRSYFSQIDIPGINDTFRATILQYATIKYSILYSDYFDGKMQVLKRSDYGYALSGRISESKRALNQPDWITPVSETTKIYNRRLPINLGCDSGLTVRSFKELPQFVYFMLFYKSGVAGYSCDLHVRIDILNEDGTTITDINPGNIGITNFNIIRIPLSVSSLSLANHSNNILSYTVRIFPAGDPNRAWKRTFVLQEKPFFTHLFFLQNRLGVLESFFIDNESREKSIEGEVVKKNGLNEIDITETSVVYTAKTGYKTIAELKLLEQAISSPFNYKIVDGKPLPITILPDTFSIADEAEELQSMEFQYMFNIGESNMGSGANVEDQRDHFDSHWIEEVVELDDTYSVDWNDGERFNKKSQTNEMINTEFKQHTDGNSIY